MAQVYLAIQASSVPCEWVFSSSKDTDSYLWTWLTLEHFGKIQLAKSHLQKMCKEQREEKEGYEQAVCRKWDEKEAVECAETL
jgi:hypothetical protein